MRFSKFLFSLFFVFGIVFVWSGFLYAQTKEFILSPLDILNKESADSSKVLCPQDVKLCPDGSYVGRTGPNCEFAPCPGETSSCGQIRCLRYDPVCGTDGKTYSCGEADALSCGVQIAYKGECRARRRPVDQKLIDYEKCGPQPGAPGNWICKDGKWILPSSVESSPHLSPAPPPPIPSSVSSSPSVPLSPATPEFQSTIKPTSTFPSPKIEPIAVCYIPDNLTKEFNQLIFDLKKAEESGNKELSLNISQKISVLKQEIEKAKKECSVKVPQPSLGQVIAEPLAATFDSLPQVVEINRCEEANQWENKIAYYKNLDSLSDEELKAKSLFTREEIKKILEELYQGIEKVKEQCQEQQNLENASQKVTTPSGHTIVRNIRKPIRMMAPTRPVVVDSGEEISAYYKAKIEEIVNEGTPENQAEKLKELRKEVDNLIVKLIKEKEKIDVSELKDLVSEIKITPQEIKTDDVSLSLRGIEKKDIRRGMVIAKVSGNSLTIVPAENKVVIEDKNLKVDTEDVVIKDDKLFVGNSQVKLSPSQVTNNLNILPKAAELKEENGKAVYKFKVSEPKKLLGFIPINITKTMNVDAENGNVLAENLPWWKFLVR